MGKVEGGDFSSLPDQETGLGRYGLESCYRSSHGFTLA
jgi:hypothetical protein